MKIAVVDDEKIWRDKVCWYVRHYFEEGGVEITLFPSGESFLADAQEYQIVFMDIEMPGMDGFEALKIYRTVCPDSICIILTAHIEMSRKGYKIRAFRYIGKCEMDEIKEALDSAMLRMKRYQSVEFQMPSMEIRKVCSYDVVYIEVYNHVVLLHMRTGDVILCAETLTDLAQRLQNKGFALTGRSYLVNMEHVRNIGQKQITLKDRTMIPVSRRKYAEVRKAYFEWKISRSDG